MAVLEAHEAHQNLVEELIAEVAGYNPAVDRELLEGGEEPSELRCLPLLLASHPRHGRHGFCIGMRAPPCKRRLEELASVRPVGSDGRAGKGPPVLMAGATESAPQVPHSGEE